MLRRRRRSHKPDLSRTALAHSRWHASGGTPARTHPRWHNLVACCKDGRVARGGVSGLVVGAVFKTVARQKLSWAGSIPVRLRALTKP